MIPCAMSFRYAVRSNRRSSGPNISPLSNALVSVSPASIGLMPSFERTLAIFGVIVSPFDATTVSLATHMLPPSILVGTLISPNSPMTGPGGILVFPAGIMMSPVAMSPPFAGTLILLFSRRMTSRNGLICVRSRMLDPVRSLTNSPIRCSCPPDASTAFRNKLFLATSIVTLSLSLFLSSWIWEERTLVRSAAAITGYSFSNTCNWLSASIFHSAIFLVRVVDIVLPLLSVGYLDGGSHAGFEPDP